jgi:hypothetical protein
MEQKPTSNRNNLKAHQDAIVDIFPEAKKAIYGESSRPDFVRLIQRGSTERLARDYERQDQLKEHLKYLVPNTYESYMEDLKLLQKHDSNARLLDVRYDPFEEKITAPGVYMKDTFISSPRIGGSMGRNMSTRATVGSDYIASIQKRTLIINDEGTPEDLYILEITRHNSDVHDDIHGNWDGEEGDRMIRIAIDPTYDDIIAEAPAGTINRSEVLASTIEIIEKGFPRTWK